MNILFLILLSCLVFWSPASYAAGGKVVVGYWGFWESKLLPMEQIPWSHITHLNYGFATMDDSAVPTLSSKAQLVKLTALAHQNNVKVLLSIGGWFGSRSMSTMASTADNRTLFVNQAVDWVMQFGLDGIDIDWEYPGRSALECNTLDYANDADNLLLVLQQLRQALDEAFETLQSDEDEEEGRKLLTVAVGATPFAKNNVPMTDVSQFASAVDWIFLMMYDTYAGRMSTTGPNAPLYTSNATGAATQSVVQAWEAWTGAHMPSDKIVLGMPFYGYAAKPRTDMLHQTAFLATTYPTRPQGDADDALTAGPCAGAKRSFSGLWKWRSLRTTGILLDAAMPGGQWIKSWDEASQTPWLYHPVSRLLIAYDDPDSLAIKTNFGNCHGLRGVGVWDLAFDSYATPGDPGQLLQAVHHQLDLPCQVLAHPQSRRVGPHFDTLTPQQLFGLTPKEKHSQSNRLYPSLFILLIGLLVFSLMLSQ